MGKELPAGVYPLAKKNGGILYRASITVHGKHISLGSYPDASLAGAAYLQAGMLLSDSSITIASYSASAHALYFEKWVSLINLRDNGIYLANPIYIRPKMFYYYLSCEEILKFDADDLFYYSSHKIMKRGRHLFIADYGMQTSLISRYGIKPHAVAGRDYLFLNGDDMDFRYANIQILNPYHGVQQITQKGKTFYKARINVPGLYTIGCYDCIEKAAIAYNKAADILRSKGYTKTYPVNFIDNLSARQYADWYTGIEISEKLRRLPAPYAGQQ